VALIDGLWITPQMFGELAEITGAHRTTVRRWYDRRRLPAAVRRLIELAWEGRLERLHGAWCGFRLDVKTGELETPDGVRITPAELAALRYRYAELAELRTAARLRERGRPPQAALQALAQQLELALVALERALDPGNFSPDAGEGRAETERGNQQVIPPFHGRAAVVYRRRRRRVFLRRTFTTRPPRVV
jgi:hypothetical protein